MEEYTVANGNFRYWGGNFTIKMSYPKFKDGKTHTPIIYHYFSRTLFGFYYESPVRLSNARDFFPTPVANSFYYSLVRANGTYEARYSCPNSTEDADSTLSVYSNTYHCGIAVFTDGTLIAGNRRGACYIVDDSEMTLGGWGLPYIGNYSDTADFWDRAKKGTQAYTPWGRDVTTAGGGNGQWDDTNSDTISIPSVDDINTYNITKSWFATTYNIAFNDLKALAGNFWSPTVIEIIKETFSTNPTDAILSLSLIPINLSGERAEVIIGNYHSGVYASLITNQFVKVNCGKIKIPERWAGAIDYQSKVSIMLPFIGVRELNVQEVMNSEISVEYSVDVMTGCCVCFIKVERGGLNSVLYQFTGNCAYNLPLSQASYVQYMQAILTMTANVGVGIATGSLSAQSIVGDASSVVANASPRVTRAGSLAGNAGYMGIRKPYIILERPHQALPADMDSFKGYQCHITKTLSEVSGYTEIEYIHLEGITRATAEELAEIERLLKEGVII